MLRLASPSTRPGWSLAAANTLLFCRRNARNRDLAVHHAFTYIAPFTKLSGATRGNGGQVLENVAAIVTPWNKRNSPSLGVLRDDEQTSSRQAEITVSRGGKKKKNKREILCKFPSCTSTPEWSVAFSLYFFTLHLDVTAVLGEA